MTVTGTLLLGWTDPSGTVAGLRQQLAATFPGASSKQSNIIHTSLLRVVTTPTPQQQKQQQQQHLDEAEQSPAVGSDGGSSSDGDPQQQQQQQLPAAVVAAVSELCERLTRQHRGLCVSVGQLHWVIEEMFSTVQGSQVAAPLAPLPQLCGGAGLLPESGLGV